VQPPTCPFALGAHTWIGQPNRGHEIAAGELREHPGVDPVGLAGQRRESFYLLRVGDLDLPASELEPVVDEAGAVHRLDRRADRRAVPIEPLSQTTKTVGVRRRRTNLHGRTLTVEQVEVETLATEIQTGVQHESGPPLRKLLDDKPEPVTRGGPSSWHSLPWRLPYHGGFGLRRCDVGN